MRIDRIKLIAEMARQDIKAQELADKAKVVHECIGRQCDFFNDSTDEQERALFDALHLDGRDAIRAWLHTYFSELNDNAQYSEKPNALDELHRAPMRWSLYGKPTPTL